MRPEHPPITLDAPRADRGLGQAVADALGLPSAEIPSRTGRSAATGRIPAWAKLGSSAQYRTRPLQW
jgi:hypothetical protein